MLKVFKKWKWAILGGILILALAVFLRVYNLTILPIFADEAIYIRWAQVMRAEPTLRFLPLSDGKQPLFMWMVIPFLKIFSDPLVAGRMVSVLSGISTLTGIFVLSFILFKSKKVSIIASLLYAVSPFGVFFDRMALVDSMLSMFGVWILTLGVVVAKKLRLDTAMITGFALGGALLTKSPALFFAILLPTAYLLSSWPKSPKAILVHLIKAAFLLLISYGIGYGMYNVLRLGPNFNMIGSRNQDYILPFSHLWTNPKDPFVFYFDRSFEWLRMLGPSLLIILGLVGIFANLKKFPREIALLSLWFIFPILVQSEFAKVFTARYILFSVPYLGILAASSFLIHSRIGRNVLMVVLLFTVFFAFKTDYLLLTDPEKASLPRSERSGYLEEWTSGYGIRETADFIRNQARNLPAGRQVVVGTEGFFGTLPDGLQIYVNNIPNVTVIGVGVSISDVHPSLVESKKAGNSTYLLVNNTRFSGDANKLGLKLIAAYPKAVRPDGSREALLFYEITKSALLLSR